MKVLGKKQLVFCLLPFLFLSLFIGYTFQDVSAAPTVGTNINVTNNSNGQNEPMVAFNPSNNSKLLVGYNDNRSGVWKVGWSWSDNGGSSWTFGNDFSFSGYLRGADPTVAFDNQSTAYFAGLAYNYDSSGFGRDGSVFLAKSNDNGHTFSVFQKIVASGSGTNPHLDKPWMCVNTLNNYIYLAWVKRTNAWSGPPNERSTIWFTRSTNGGVTFSNPIQVGSDLDLTTYPLSHGPQIAFGPGNKVYVSWHTAERGTLGGSNWRPPKIWIANSSDGGATFGASNLVATKQNSLPAIFISMGTDASTGRIYVTYAERPTYPGDLDVYVATSISTTGPWTIKKVNNDPIGNGNNQLWSTLDVAPNGRVDVIWYDHRDDPNKCSVYYSASRDGGFTWEPNTKITNLASGFTWPSDRFAGDYITIASLVEKAQAVWMDNRQGNQEIYTAKLTMPSPASFLDGFESGTFSAWTGAPSVSSGETAMVVNTSKHHGTYSAKFSTNGGGGTEYAYCIKSIVSSSELYARAYINVAQSGILDENDRFYCMILQGSGSVAYVGWKKTGGSVKWEFSASDKTRSVFAYSTTSPLLKQWYCVEIHWKKDETVGLAELWINNAKICSMTNINTTALGDVTITRFGLPQVDNCGSTTAYLDCVKVSTSYIGPEPFSFSDGFETLNFKGWTGTSGTLGETETVSNSRFHHGLYSAKFTSNGNGGTERAYCYKSLTPPQFELYARGYYTISSISSTFNKASFIAFKAGVTTVATAGMRYYNGLFQWQLSIRNGTDWVNTYKTFTVSTSQWVSIELYWKEDPTSGGAGVLWVNGVKTCSITNVNTGIYGDVSRMEFGLPEIYNCGSITLYCDCVRAANAYISLETAKLTG